MFSNSSCKFLRRSYRFLTVPTAFKTITVKNRQYFALKRSVSCMTRLGSQCRIQYCNQCTLTAVPADNLASTETTFLRSKIIKDHYLTIHDIDNILLDVSKQQISPGLCSVLLQCCIDFIPSIRLTDKLGLAKRIWETCEKNGYKFTTEDTHRFIDVYAAAKQPIPEDDPWLDPSLLSDKESLLLILQCSAEIGDLEVGAEALMRMKQLGFSIGEETFACLILCHGRRHDYKSVSGILNTMKDSAVAPAAATYLALLQTQIENEQPINQTLKHIREEGITFNDKQLTKLIHSIALSKRENLLNTVMRIIEIDKLSIEIKNCAVELIYDGYHELAMRLVAENPIMFGSNEHPSTFALFLPRELVASNKKPEIILQMCSSLQNSFPSHQSFLLAATEASLRDTSKTVVSIELLKHVSPLRTHYFWPLSVRSNDISMMIEVLNLMQSFGLRIDYDTLAYYVFPNIITTDQPINLLQKLQKSCNLSVSTLLGPLLLALLNAKMVEDAVILCKQYKQRTIDPFPLIKPLMSATLTNRNIKLTVTMLNYLFSSKTERPIDVIGLFLVEFSAKCSTSDLTEVLKILQEQKLYISLASYEMLSSKPPLRAHLPLLDSITNTSSDGTSSFSQLPHPRDMGVNDLEAHLIELQSKGLNTRGVLRKLVQMHCRLNNPTRANQIKQELEKQGFELSPGILASFFTMYLQTKDAKNAKSILERIISENPSFKLDEFKIIDYCTLMVQNGSSIDQIKSILQDFVLRRQKNGQDIKGGPGIARNCETLSQNIKSSLGQSAAECLSQCLIELKFIKK